MNSDILYLSTVQDCPFVDEWYALAQQEHFWMQWRHRALLQLLSSVGLDFRSSLNVLDIGGGNGMVQAAVERDTKWTVDCVDLNLAGLKTGRSGRGRKIYYNIHEQAPELVGQYDAVFLMDVIEHVSDPGAFLRSATQHLKPGGLVVVNVPALQSLYSVYDRHVGHLRRYNKKSLRADFASARLEIVQSRYWGMALVPILAIRKAYLALQGPSQKTVEQGFQPPAEWIHGALRLLLEVETRLLPTPPVGSSLLMVGRVQEPSIA